jgi:hypothetical protein
MIMAKQAETKKKTTKIDKEFLDRVDTNIKKDKKLLDRLSKA